MIDKIQETVAYIKSKVTLAEGEIDGIVLGTGLGNLVSDIDIQDEVDYEEILNFPLSTVESHKGKLIFGRLGDRNVIAMQGRFHYYEGYSMQPSQSGYLSSLGRGACLFPMRPVDWLPIWKTVI